MYIESMVNNELITKIKNSKNYLTIFAHESKLQFVFVT